MKTLMRTLCLILALVATLSLLPVQADALTPTYPIFMKGAYTP